jgi:hypothetical protein
VKCGGFLCQWKLSCERHLKTSGKHKLTKSQFNLCGRPANHVSLSNYEFFKRRE